MAVWDGLDVLDLSWGVAGPLAGMLAAASGAGVTKIEPPGGDPSRALSGARVWNRGKRSAVLDLRDAADRDRLLALAGSADVLIEAYSPGTTRDLGIDYDTLHARNPRLVYCSITAYGETGANADRPGYDALVAARTGQQWESRGVVGGTIQRLSGYPIADPDIVTPEDCWVGSPRQGPLFGGIPWVSIGAGYLATLAIAAALRAREITGAGQHVHTSLLQGAFLTTIGGWQRVEHPEAPGFLSTITDPRAPKGLFRCADGRWIHNWGPNAAFALGEVGKEVPGDGANLGPTGGGGLAAMYEVWPAMIDAYASMPASEWVERAKRSRRASVQPVRSPEEALLDPDFAADGCVVDVDDPEVGAIRAVGRVIDLRATPAVDLGAAPSVGAHTADVRAEADRALRETSTAGRSATSSTPGDAPGDSAGGIPLGAPLEGVRVLDFGNAVAGPFGAQLLGDLGADVIKVNTAMDAGWMRSHIAYLCNRSKRSIAVDLEEPEGREIVRQLLLTADVVHHNLGRGAIERMGIDYDSVKAINPNVVYCRTRAHEYSEVRRGVSGHDQSAAALTGTTWTDGGMDRGGKPHWPVVSLGDTGNGLLSAIGVIQALQHRDRTGEGQYVTTSIVYAHLVNNSMAWASTDGSTPGDRPLLDAMQLGWNALYRLYETADGWLCIAALTDDHFRRLCEGVGRTGLVGDSRFATPEARAANDDGLTQELGRALANRSAGEWFEVLDAAGVPCEISDPGFVLRVFDDPEMQERGWVAHFDHAVVGSMDTFGLLVDLSDTPGRISGPPLVVGECTREILAELGYDDAEIDNLAEKGVVTASAGQRPAH